MKLEVRKIGEKKEWFGEYVLNNSSLSINVRNTEGPLALGERGGKRASFALSPYIT